MSHPTRHAARNSYAGQQLMMTLILWYRRRLSGRGPLAQVRCTFANTESCSAYGLRMVLEARSLLAALRLIFARLRRCGTASLYQLPGGFSWGEIYDDCAPAELEARLTASRERPETRAQIFGSAGLVAARCGRLKEARAHLARAAALCDKAPRPHVRRTTGLARSLRARLWRRLALLAATASVLGWLLSGPALWAGVGVLSACALASTVAHRRRTRRHGDLLVASAFTVPVDPSQTLRATSSRRG